MGQTLRPVEARPNRRAENRSGVIAEGAASPLATSYEVWETGTNVSSHSKLPPVGSGADPRKIWNFEHFGISKSRQNGLSDSFLIQCPCHSMS